MLVIWKPRPPSRSLGQHATVASCPSPAIIFKNSNECLTLLQVMELPENTFLFTADAKSMHTNINTDAALKIIPEYLIENKKRFNYNAEAVIAALHITFKNNLFRFNDWFAKQKSGTAMGKRPAPPWATLFFEIKESGMNGEKDSSNCLKKY